MQVFVLCTGRCGSRTFYYACAHMTNFTAGHEMRRKRLGKERLDYPGRHIEVDNRLSWILGRLDQRWGDHAHYVHLTRNPEEVARSYAHRLSQQTGIIHAYRTGILMKSSKADPLDICRDYVDTVTANIEHFLSNKTKKMKVALETAQLDFETFWHWIGAEGDLAAALSEWNIKRHATVFSAPERPLATIRKLSAKGRYLLSKIGAVRLA